MQVIIVVFGSREPMFFDYDLDDGWGNIRKVIQYQYLFNKFS